MRMSIRERLQDGVVKLTALTGLMRPGVRCTHTYDSHYGLNRVDLPG